MASIDTDIYVILQPRSITNPSDYYRVVSYRAWLRAYDSGTPENYKHESYETHADALAARDELNSNTA